MNEVAKAFNDDLEAEGTLVGSKDLYRILFEFAPDAFYLNDLEARFVNGIWGKPCRRKLGLLNRSSR